jgi:NAD(P) transhydrogenase
VWDSDRILELEKLPRRLAVIGAGVIGSEYASTFNALGCEVHVVDGRDALLAFLDAELSRRLQAAMAKLGVRFHWKERVKACRAPARGAIRLELTSGARLDVDAVLVAAGRRACVEELGLEAAGLAVNERHLLEVDAQFRTRLPHVFAAGDVVGFPSLASVSAEQARVAVCAAFAVPFKKELTKLFPTGIYTIPEVSTVGPSEEALREQGVDYVVGRGEYSNNARGAIIGDRAGFLKLLFRRRDLKLLAAHMMGEQATELVHVGMMTMVHGGGAAELQHACFNVPTLSTLYKDAAYRAQIARDLPRVARRIGRGAAR